MVATSLLHGLYIKVLQVNLRFMVAIALSIVVWIIVMQTIFTILILAIRSPCPFTRSGGCARLLYPPVVRNPHALASPIHTIGGRGTPSPHAHTTCIEPQSPSNEISSTSHFRKRLIHFPYITRKGTLSLHFRGRRTH